MPEKITCEICKNNDNRTYAHSLTNRHRKLLIKKLSEIKKEEEKKLDNLFK